MMYCIKYFNRSEQLDLYSALDHTFLLVELAIRNSLHSIHGLDDQVDGQVYVPRGHIVF